MPALLYADDLVLCGESEEDLQVVVGHFVEVCRKRSVKVKVIVLSGRRDWSVKSVWMGRDWSKGQSSNFWSIFWMNEVQM